MSGKLEINTSRHFTHWLAEQQVSLVFSTYQAGKLFFIGAHPETGKLSVFERTFERAMGLHVKDNSLYLATLYQIWRFENMLEPGQRYEQYDALYVPQMSNVTGDLDVHDIATGETGGLYFVNTLFSCVAKASVTHSFKPVWQPPFISRLAAEDRCHLNGLAMCEGKPRYVTAVSTTDVHEGWRNHRQDGGVLMDIDSNDIMLDGLSMPHSPRWYNDHVWLVDSGHGELIRLNPETGQKENICFCPGYARGLTLHNQYALLGLSKPRHNKNFNGLALDDRLAEKNVTPRCGLQVVNLQSGDVEHSLTLDGVVEEIYDVAVIPNVQTPMALGFKTSEIQKMVSVAP